MRILRNLLLAVAGEHLAGGSFTVAVSARAPDNWQTSVRTLDPSVTADAKTLTELDLQPAGRPKWRDASVDDVYELTFEWWHTPSIMPSIPPDAPAVRNAGGKEDWELGACSTDPTVGWDAPSGTAANGDALDKQGDGLPYWYPRFIPAPVLPEVTEKTGVTFASVDWQPCGHTDIVICHAESHYDFHLYYVPESELQPYTCNQAKPYCPDTLEWNGSGAKNGTLVSTMEKQTQQEQNDKFFKLIKGEKLVSRHKVLSAGAQGNLQGGQLPAPTIRESVDLDFCVDKTSAIPRSGVHYGDTKETLEEWVTPVSITGSYDCQLTFFEPMFSRRWFTGSTAANPENVPDTSAKVHQYPEWPRFDSGLLEYDEAVYRAIPRRWHVTVADADTAPGNEANCKRLAGNVKSNSRAEDGDNDPDKICRIKLVVYGKQCPPGGCGTPIKADSNCQQAKECVTQQPFGVMPNQAYGAYGGGSTQTSGLGGGAAMQTTSSGTVNANSDANSNTSSSKSGSWSWRHGAGAWIGHAATALCALLAVWLSITA